MISYLPILKTGGILLLVIFAYSYVKSLRSDLEVERANNSKLVSSVELQKEVIEQQRIDFENFKIVSDNLQKILDEQERSIKNLENKFNRNSRDIGKLAIEKPNLIENIINKATIKVNRCFEIATGAEVKKDEKNSECSELLNSSNL